jgi:hypothetical protein
MRMGFASTPLVSGQEIGLEPERRPARGPAEDEPPRRRQGADKEVIDDAVIVAGNRHAVRTVVVKLGPVDIASA